MFSDELNHASIIDGIRLCTSFAVIDRLSDRIYIHTLTLSFFSCFSHPRSLPPYPPLPRNHTLHQAKRSALATSTVT